MGSRRLRREGGRPASAPGAPAGELAAEVWPGDAAGRGPGFGTASSDATGREPVAGAQPSGARERGTVLQARPRGGSDREPAAEAPGRLAAGARTAEAPLDQLSIVVVTWHSAGEVPPLLASLGAAVAAGAELVVVENGSGDGTPALVRAAMPTAVVLENAANRGFAAAANQGLAVGRRPYVLFLNPDTVVPDATIPCALAHLVREPSIGVLGCRTLDAEGTPQPTVDRFHTVGGLVRDALLGRRWAGVRPRRQVPPATVDVEWVYGSFLLCRRGVLERVGGFDEAYEMYGEDLDLCLRVTQAGARIVYFAEAAIIHHGNRSGARRYGADRDVAVLKGTLRFFRRHRGRGAERAFRLLAGASFAMKAGVGAVRALGPGGREAAARARTYARMAWLCARGDPAATGENGRASQLRPPEVPGIEGS